MLDQMGGDNSDSRGADRHSHRNHQSPQLLSFRSGGGDDDISQSQHHSHHQWLVIEGNQSESVVKYKVCCKSSCKLMCTSSTQ